MHTHHAMHLFSSTQIINATKTHSELTIIEGMYNYLNMINQLNSAKNRVCSQYLK